MNSAFEIDAAPPGEMLRAIADWSLTQQPLSDLALPHLAPALDSLPWDRAHPRMVLIWEFHHDGSHRVDVSLGLKAREGEWNPHLLPIDGYEYDISESGANLMGRFMFPRYTLVRDPGTFTQQALASCESDVSLSTNIGAQELVALLGAPEFIGVTSRGSGTRLLFGLPDESAWAQALSVLRAHGTTAHATQHAELVSGLIAQGVRIRLAVDADPTRIAPSAAVEVFVKGLAPALITSVYEGLIEIGCPAQMVAESRAVMNSEVQVVPLTESAAQRFRGDLSLEPSHVKVSVSRDGVRVKSYTAVLGALANANAQSD